MAAAGSGADGATAATDCALPTISTSIAGAGAGSANRSLPARPSTSPATTR